MPARLLAHGGSRHGERVRIGSWSGVPRGTLEDRYGLEHGTAYGLGRLDGSFFLVLRQLQNPQSRGGYPYSLLLDPGERVWRAFGWNAALLAHRILSDEEAVRLLLNDVEACTPGMLDEMLSRLGAAPVAEHYATGLEALWVGALLERDPVAVPVAERPEPAALASALERLPPCFRTSAGWLVGAALAHAVSLGARIVLDEQATAWPKTVAQNGRAILVNWRQFGVRAFSEVPAPAWRVDAAGFLRRWLEYRDLHARSYAQIRPVL